MSRTRQSIAVVSAVSGELTNPFSSDSHSLGLQSERSGGLRHESLRYSNTHIHDWTDETASPLAGRAVCIHVCVCLCVHVSICACMYMPTHMHDLCLYVCIFMCIYIHWSVLLFERLQRHFLVPGSVLIRMRSSQDLNTLQIEETISALLFYNQ